MIQADVVSRNAGGLGNIAPGPDHRTSTASQLPAGTVTSHMAAAFSLFGLCMQEAWATIALGVDYRTPMAYHWRARARSWYGYLAGAKSDWQDAIRYFSYIPYANRHRKPQFEQVCNPAPHRTAHEHT